MNLAIAPRPRRVLRLRQILATAITVVASAMVAPAAIAGPTGACCLPDGGCDDLSFAACEAIGGGYIGDGTDCATSDCENITGGCCLSEAAGGNCLSLTFEQCIAQDGVIWAPFVDCQNACPGACCFNGAPCQDLGQVDCEQFGGFFQGNGTSCDAVSCDPFGGCCLPDGSCDVEFEVECATAGGMYLGNGTDCVGVDCPDPTGACCLPTGVCVADETQIDCEGMGGTYSGDNSGCVPNDCPQPPETGACCFDDGTCQPDETEADCLADGGTWQGAETASTPNDCPQPPEPGACCFFDGTCSDGLDALACDDLGGRFQGGGTACDPDLCPQLVLRASATEKGSLLMFSHIETGWSDSGEIVTDTFVQLTNDSPDDVRVLMYWINGSAPGEGTPGWNYIDVEVTLTGNQTIYWSAVTGDGSILVPPISVLDPGAPHSAGSEGEEDGASIHAYIYAFAVSPDDDLEIKHNHLTGTATRINYAHDTASEYNALAYRRRTEDPGDADLKMDGVEYDESYAQLVLNFIASGSTAWSGPGMMTMNETRITLHPAGADVRPDSPSLPITTKADYTVWNENEVKLSGAYRCITCFDSTWLSDYGIPNHFTRTALQTDAGKARIIGLESVLCNNGPYLSEDAALVGVSHRRISFDIANASSRSRTATNLIGIGSDPSASIQYTPADVPPEAPEVDPPARRKLRRAGTTTD